MKLIIQIPAFNEELNIAAALADLPKTIAGITSIETLVIDDGSSDATADIATKAGATRVLRLTSHRGLATAFLAGLDTALRMGADIIVNTDADGQYRGTDIPRLIQPLLEGRAEVVIGDREVARSPHMGAMKRSLQRLGSWTVSLASGINLPDVTSGFRAFSREAAMQINVFNPFTYTLETIIQAGQRNLHVASVPITTNPPTRPSRLYRGIGSYVRKSAATIFRMYVVYRPLKTFFAIGAVLFSIGVALGLRFIYFYANGVGGGHVQSLILAAVFLIIGFQTLLIALLADLISVNRRINEEILTRLRRLKSEESVPTRTRKPVASDVQQRRERPERKSAAIATPATAATTEWVWIEGKESNMAVDHGTPVAAPLASPRKRRRRKRGDSRHFSEVRPHHHKSLEEKAADPRTEGESD